MSIKVPVDELESRAAGYGTSAYVLVAARQGPPRVTHSMVRFDRGDLIVIVGGRSAAALGSDPAVAILWPATGDQSMSLIVDGRATGVIEADGGEIRIEPTGAVQHRPAAP